MQRIEFRLAVFQQSGGSGSCQPVADFELGGSGEESKAAHSGPECIAALDSAQAMASNSPQHQTGGEGLLSPSKSKKTKKAKTKKGGAGSEQQPTASSLQSACEQQQQGLLSSSVASGSSSCVTDVLQEMLQESLCEELGLLAAGGLDVQEGPASAGSSHHNSGALLLRGLGIYPRI